MEPEWTPPAAASLRAGLRLLFATNARRAAGLFVTGLGLGLFPLVVAAASKRLIDTIPLAVSAGGFATDPGRTLTVTLVIIAALLIGRDALDYWYVPRKASFALEVENHARDRALKALHTPPGIRHLEDPDIAKIVGLAGRDYWPNREAFVEGLSHQLSTRTAGLAGAAIVFAFDWRLGTGLLALWVFVAWRLRRAFAKVVVGLGTELREANYLRELAFLPEAAKELRIFGLARWLIKEFDRTKMSVMRTIWDSRVRTVREIVVLAVITIAVNLFALAVLIDAVASGGASIGSLALLGPAIMSLGQLAVVEFPDTWVANGVATLPAIEILEDMAVNDPRLVVTGTRDPEKRPTQDISFEQVQFSYPSRPDEVIFDGLDLTIRAGQSTAIVGSNGAGKTTLVKLLARLYEPTGGCITVDGIDVADFDAAMWQRRVAAIFQDFVQYPLTVRENITFGAVEHADDLVAAEAALARVGAADLIDELDNGWDTILSKRYQGGTELSGGQWQRLALARAIMAVDAGAGVLVLDEPTANLDVRAEVELFDRFLDVTRGATTVLISHRFSTVRRVDRIVLLEHGRVVEDGSHDELLAMGGRYARAFHLQADRFVDPAVLADERRRGALAVGPVPAGARPSVGGAVAGPDATPAGPTASAGPAQGGGA